MVTELIQLIDYPAGERRALLIPLIHDHHGFSSNVVERWNKTLSTMKKPPEKTKTQDSRVMDAVHHLRG